VFCALPSEKNPRSDQQVLIGEQYKMYSDSELTRARGWTDEYLATHFVVVKAAYFIEYDNTKTFPDGGNTVQYFYLIQDIASGEWTISDAYFN
jgi:hypothetical protein